MELLTPGPLLAQINSPEDLKKVDKADLPQVCAELRQFIIDVVSVHGGHFGASLGVVELTVALHYALNTPDDQLVWDVGHQAYGHKILTGRRDRFHTNRKYGGLSGFPKRSESEYDTFGVGHSSTSISAALGMAIASKLKGEDRQHVAVIGDGSMTAGLPFEALNHAGVAGANVLVILNDNNMSIDPAVGALKEYLTDITTSPTWNRLRDQVWKALGKGPAPTATRAMASKIEASVKGVVSKSSNLFEALGMRYFGPVDGHNVIKLAETIKDLGNIPGPKLLHVKTVKGKGYELAEKDQTLWAAGTDASYTSHGAHVAGIAAGSGAGGPGGSERFRGIAYRSDLVLVGITPSPQNWTSTGMTDIIDGMAYIFNYAASVGKPAVANLSWGCTIGPHDGLSLFSQACDALTGPGKIFCLSAGNNGGNNIHLSKTFSATDTLVRTTVNFPNTPSGRKTWVDIWGDTAQSFCVRATLFSGTTRVDSTTLICLNNSTQNLYLIGSTGDTCFVTAITESVSFNGKPRVLLSMYSKTGNTLCLSIKSNSGTVDAWMGFVENSTGYYGSFTSSLPGTVAGNTVMSVGDMATTKSAITVGAFNSKRSYTNVSGANVNLGGTAGAIASFSSRGPTADGRVKPDITAPGSVLASSVSSYDPSFANGGGGYSSVVHNYVHPTNSRTYPYAVLQGTSMSSPVVSGVVALMLQATPTLTPTDVRTALAETAIRDTHTGTYPAGISSNTWGAGKVNAYRALKRVLEGTGVQDIGESTLACLLFPNPGRGQFSLELVGTKPALVQVSVQNLQGREVQRESWHASTSQRVRTFDWSTLTPGTYLVHVEGGEHQSATMKLVVR